MKIKIVTNLLFSTVIETLFIASCESTQELRGIDYTEETINWNSFQGFDVSVPEKAMVRVSTFPPMTTKCNYKEPRRLSKVSLEI